MKTAMDRVLEEIAAQIDWIEEHGRTLTGYVERYGAATDPDKFGDGGEAIYAADTGALKMLLTYGRRWTHREALALFERARGCGGIA